ncbi:MAG: nucleoside hydrolase [Anaerolineae bacterium]
MSEKILLDTDIGSDIDDAVCLAYLLAQPDCELLGVTTVTGEGARRAALVSALCKIAQQDVPIHVGAETPLLVDQRQPHVPQAAALERWPHETDFPRGEAIEFMRQTIRAHPGEVTLLTIGPLTNAALLFSVDPEIPQLLKGLVMMGGVFGDGDPRHPERGAEWNAMLDPHATAIVFRAPVAVHRAVGLNVTLQVKMDADEVRRRFDAPLLRPVRDFAEVWFEERDEIVFHDPLAAVTIFDEEVCGFTRGRVAVDLEAQPGRTGFTPEKDGPHEVATTVDAARFFQDYFEVVEG